VSSRCVVLWGDDSDPPLQRVEAELSQRGVETFRIASELDLVYELELGHAPSGWLRAADIEVEVGRIAGWYVRPAEPPPHRARAGAALSALASSLPVPVVNRPTAGRSNASKPFHLQLLARAGFDVPETLVTTIPSAAADFSAQHGRVIYKSTSGVRSIVAVLDPDGAPDTAFAPRGFRVFDLGGPADFFWGVALSPDTQQLAIAGFRGVGNAPMPASAADDAVLLLLQAP